MKDHRFLARFRPKGNDDVQGWYEAITLYEGFPHYGAGQLNALFSEARDCIQRKHSWKDTNAPLSLKLFLVWEMAVETDYASTVFTEDNVCDLLSVMAKRSAKDYILVEYYQENGADNELPPPYSWGAMFFFWCYPFRLTDGAFMRPKGNTIRLAWCLSACFQHLVDRSTDLDGYWSERGRIRESLLSLSSHKINICHFVPPLLVNVYVLLV